MEEIFDNFHDEISIQEFKVKSGVKYINSENKINYDEIVRKIRVGDDTAWETLAFLKKCKATMPGFDF